MNKLDKDYQNILQDILENGNKKSDRTGTGTISVFGRQIRHKMSDGFPLLTTKKMYIKGIITELLWFLSGDTNIKYLVENNCNIWNGDAYKSYLKYNKNSTPISKEEFVNLIKTDSEFAKKHGELGPIYGKQWRCWSGVDKELFFNSDDLYDINKNARHGLFFKELEIDQITSLINNLKNNPDSRRLMVTAWNPSDLQEQTLPPCHYGFQCYTRELSLKERRELARVKGLEPKWSFELDDGRPTENSLTEDEHYNKYNIPSRELSLKWQQRSCDFPLGIPYNIASYGFLLEILSKKVNMVPGELIGDLGDCHIYLNQIEGVKEQLSRSSYELPKIKLNNDLDWLNYDLDSMIYWMSQNLDDWFEIVDYNSNSTIKFPLSN